MYEDEYMKMAIDESEQGIMLGDGGPFGAVIVKDDKVIAIDHNHVLQNNDPTAHGEISAIRIASQKLGTFDLSGCELYTSAYPCPMCISAIMWANIKTVYYGNTANDTANIGFRDEFMYSAINGNEKDTQILSLQCKKRDEANKVFKNYKAMNADLY